MLTKIVLIGPPGAGKSSVGRALSKELSMPFIDSDSEIEKLTGKTISEIFVDDGEQIFRKLEVDVVSKLLTDFTGVIALGGGAPITMETQNKLESCDFPIVFIDVSISQAANRFGFNKDRPLLLINPRQQWLNLMNDRRPIYERLATEIVSSDNKKPVEVAKIISEKLKSKS
jgi:shikimate kinase